MYQAQSSKAAARGWDRSKPELLKPSEGATVLDCLLLPQSSMEGITHRCVQLSHHSVRSKSYVVVLLVPKASHRCALLAAQRSWVHSVAAAHWFRVHSYRLHTLCGLM